MSTLVPPRRSPHGIHVAGPAEERRAACAEEPRVGVAEALVEPEAERIDVGDGGGSIDVGDPPREPPWRRSPGGRPDRPPAWMRWLLYGMMLIACFLVGWLIGKVWARIDKAAWGHTPLFDGPAY